MGGQVDAASHLVARAAKGKSDCPTEMDSHQILIREIRKLWTRERLPHVQPPMVGKLIVVARA